MAWRRIAGTPLVCKQRNSFQLLHYPRNVNTGAARKKQSPAEGGVSSFQFSVKSRQVVKQVSSTDRLNGRLLPAAGLSLSRVPSNPPSAATFAAETPTPGVALSLKRQLLPVDTLISVWQAHTHDMCERKAILLYPRSVNHGAAPKKQIPIIIIMLGFHNIRHIAAQSRLRTDFRQPNIQWFFTMRTVQNARL